MINKPIIWKFKKNNRYLEDYKLNNKVAEKISLKGFKEMWKQYTAISPKNLSKILKLDRDVWKNIKGIGVDLGGGIGLVSSIIAKKKELKKYIVLRLLKMQS